MSLNIQLFKITVSNKINLLFFNYVFMYLGNKPNTCYETFYKVILMSSQERYNFSDLSIKIILMP